MMLKSNYLFVIYLFFFAITTAQIPFGYYNSARNLSDNNLKFALNQIIDNHIEYNYTSSDIDVWDILKETDRDPNNLNNIILIYSGISVNASQEYNNANGWTREHIWAKSRGDFGTTTGIGTDVHAIRPLDNTTNTVRNNRSFNNCSNCIDVIDKWGNLTGSKKDATEWSFEPRDEVKGDVARMIFYMDVRYEGLDSYPNLELIESILPQSDNQPIHSVLSTLLSWHRNDPVNDWEKNRNNIIYNSYQKNRNPFIDFPELAEHLWGNKIGVNWKGETLGVENFDEVSFGIYPNPAYNFLNINGITLDTKVEIYDVIGRKVLSSKIGVHNKTINISELKGIYLVKILSQEKRMTKILVK